MKTFLITGCTRGIGLATANYLNESGYQVIGIARKPSESEFPGILYCADLSNSDATLAVLDTIKHNHTVDGIINNIGNVNVATRQSFDVDDSIVPLNLQNIQFVDSSGLGVIIGRYKKLLPLGGKLKITNVPPNIYKIMELSGLPKIVSFYVDEAHAYEEGRGA